MRKEGEISPRVSRGLLEQVEFTGAGSVMVIDGDVVHQSERKDADGKRMAAVRSRA
jgi:sulfur carrier protein ThiS